MNKDPFWIDFKMVGFTKLVDSKSLNRTVSGEKTAEWVKIPDIKWSSSERHNTGINDVLSSRKNCFGEI